MPLVLLAKMLHGLRNFQTENDKFVANVSHIISEGFEHRVKELVDQKLEGIASAFDHLSRKLAQADGAKKRCSTPTATYSPAVKCSKVLKKKTECSSVPSER